MTGKSQRIIIILGALEIFGHSPEYYPPIFGVNCFGKIFAFKNFVDVFQIWYTNKVLYSLPLIVLQNVSQFLVTRTKQISDSVCGLQTFPDFTF